MRIRKRPASQAQIAAIPSPPTRASNGGDEPTGGEGGGWNPDGDLFTGLWGWREPMTKAHPTAEISSPPAPHHNGRCIIPSSHHTNLQFVKEKEEELDSNQARNGEILMSNGSVGITSSEGMTRREYNDEAEDREEKPLMGKLKAKSKGNKNPTLSMEGHANAITKKAMRGQRTVMEGSRCSRVNGRGWRCCQQTLVGYSLCEHHLGKARLRSITAVRSHQTTASTISSNTPHSSRVPIDDGELEKDEEEDGEQATATATATASMKKMKKIGIVKARSINSLFSGSNNN